MHQIYLYYLLTLTNVMCYVKSVQVWNIFLEVKSTFCAVLRFRIRFFN